MNFISCQRHPEQNILFLYLLPQETEFLCEDCVEDSEIKGQLIKINKLITIKTLLKKPEAIFKKLDLNELQDVYTNFGSDNSSSINQQIKEMEKQAQTLQQLIQEMILKFKNCVQNIEILRKSMFQDFIKDLNFEPLKQLAMCLVQSKDVTNPDAISQLKQKLHQYFQQLQKDNGQDAKNIIFTKIYKTSMSVDQEINNFKIQINSKHNQNSFIMTSLKLQLRYTLKQQNKYNQLYLQVISSIKQQIWQRKGSRDGLTGQSFWTKVNGKKNLLMIFKSKSNYIFGAYSPCQWQQNLNNYVQDKTNSSFLFSQTHDEIYPIVDNGRAIYCYSTYGPTFGGGYDIYVATDFQGGSLKLGHSYKWDKYQNQNSAHLFGQSTPNIIECEIFEILFK